MDGLGGPGGEGGASVQGCFLAARRDWPEPRRSRSLRRPPFHILQRRRGQPRKRPFTRAAGGSAPCTFTLGPRLPGEAPCGAQPISVGERGDRAVNACTGFLLKATQGPSPHTAQERAAYVDAPDFNR